MGKIPQAPRLQVNLVILWHEMALFCVLWELIFAIKTDWFFLLGIKTTQHPALIIFSFLLSPCNGLRIAYIQLFRERLSEKVHATIPKGIVGGFEFTVVQRNLKEGQERPSTYVCECY